MQVWIVFFLLFTTFVSVLPKWENHLLRNIELDSDIFTVVEMLNKDECHILATSDGSAPNFVGSFGWAAKTVTKEPIGHNKGAAPGYCATSFRAEAYGLLAVLLFIHYAYQFTGCTKTTQTTLYTNSESLITKIKYMLQWAHYYQSATMDADWDVLQAIITIIRGFETQPSIKHV